MHATLRGLPRRIGRTQAVLGAMLAVLLVAAPLSISPAAADSPPGGAGSGRIAVGPYLQAGPNTIEVKIDTDLGNRVGRATQTYGLTGISFRPYTETAVG